MSSDLHKPRLIAMVQMRSRLVDQCAGNERSGGAS